MKDPILERLKEYFKNTPKIQIEKDLKKVKKYTQIGPTVSEFLDNNIKPSISTWYTELLNEIFYCGWRLLCSNSSENIETLLFEISTPSKSYWMYFNSETTQYKFKIPQEVVIFKKGDTDKFVFSGEISSKTQFRQLMQVL